MKRRNTLPFIILSAVFFISTIVFGGLYYHSNNESNINSKIATDAIDNWFNAKDATTCLIDMTMDKATYYTCDKYVKQVIDAYEYYLKYVGEFSRYEIQE